MSESYRLESFKREAKLLAKFGGQPDIVDVLSPLAEHKIAIPVSGGSFVFDLTLPYYALELAQGSLDARMQAAPPLSWINRLEVFRSLCRSVQRIHREGLAHRDLKPGNFLVTLDDRVVLADFGTARDIDGRALKLQYGSPPGDLRYCAPEMIACLHEADPGIAFGADMFSLGAILFELFTGAQLGVFLLGRDATFDLMGRFARLSGSERRAAFDELIGDMADRYPLPSVRDFAPEVPGSISDRLDDLYKGLAAIDHSERTTAFESVFRQVEGCILILRNEETYRRWRKQRDAYRGLSKNGAVS